MATFRAVLHGERAAIQALVGVRRLIETQKTERIGRRLALQALHNVERLTPVQRHTQRFGKTKRGHPSFQSQWHMIEEISSGATYRAVIMNSATRTAAGTIALASVEFGATAHMISPKRPGRLLAWFQPGQARRFIRRVSDANRPPTRRGRNIIGDIHQDVTGPNDWVRARSVRHPGHRSFRMVRETVRIGRRSLQVLTMQFAGDIRREFGPGFSARIR